jgi:hypothetical protein
MASRPIVLQGTTGVLPGRVVGAQLGGRRGFTAVESIFAGTIRAAQNVGPRVGTFNNTHKRATIQNTDVTNGSLKNTTGYGQFLLLQQFLESYARIKKTAAGRDYRLGFAHWKNQAVYLVTPVSFDASQTVGSPMETTYSLSLRAWRRISLDRSAIATNDFTPVARTPGALQQLQKRLNDARSRTFITASTPRNRNSREMFHPSSAAKRVTTAMTRAVTTHLPRRA